MNGLPAPEFSRLADERHIPEAVVVLNASPEECTALARRFAQVRIDTLHAELALHREGRTILASGRLDAAIVQSCAVSGEDFPVRIAEPLALRFVTAQPHRPDEEVELAADELDEIEYEGTQFDLGEAVAQSLALAIDPFAVAPGAAQFRKKAGLIGAGQAGPFAALAALKTPE